MNLTDIQLDGLDATSLKTIRHLAYLAEAELDSQIAIGEREGWTPEFMLVLRKKLTQAIDLWINCTEKLLEG